MLGVLVLDCNWLRFVDVWLVWVVTVCLGSVRGYGVFVVRGVGLFVCGVVVF
ncbi:hypothetical protein [Candidatus Hodgkinia cicadicola]|uniref:hypothetical protein n=1 Tax=Candidatus Hodgkinia cicadicola TaxID=573658 RepID=UPI0024156B32